MEKRQSTRWISLIIGILFIISGCIFAFYPLESMINLLSLIAFLLLCLGILRVIRYFTDNIFRSSSFLIGGILDIILAFLIFNNKTTSLVVLATFINFWILFSGISELALAFDIRKLGFPRWYLSLISGILGIVVGMILILNPAIQPIYISFMIAIHLFSLGITFISTFITLRKANKYFDDKYL